MARKCTKCGCELKTKAKFCPECGALVEEEPKEKKVKNEQAQTSSESGEKKGKGKLIVGTVIAGAVLLGVGGFAAAKMMSKKPEEPVKKEAKADTEKKETKQTEKKEEETYRYKWIVEPKIEADQIYYEQSNIWSDIFNEYHKQDELFDYLILEKDGLKGVIDMRGSMLTELKYANIVYNFFLDTEQLEFQFETPDGEYEKMEGSSGKVEAMAAEEPKSSDPDELMDGKSWNAGYYCDGELYCVNTASAAEKTVEEVTSAVIPVQQSDKRITKLSEWLQLQGKYAIANEGELVTDFVYDECGSESDGLLAVCQDGKWGYVNKKGEVVIPIEYDASWSQYIPNSVDAADVRTTSTPKEYCYAASNGYVNLHKGTEWELRNKKGKEVIPVGVFEEILPVTAENTCWVKKDGKWGVIEVLEEAVTSTEYDDWKQAYIDWINEDYEYEDEEQRYKIIDVNGDLIPEIVNWSNKKDTRILTCGLDGYIADLETEGEEIEYIPGEDCVKCSVGSMDNYSDTVAKIVGSTWREFKGEYGSFDSNGVKLDENGVPIYTYIWDEDYMGKEEYEQCIAKLFSEDKAVTIKKADSVSADEIISQIRNYKN